MSLLPCSSCPWRTDQTAAAVQSIRPRLRRSQLLRMVGPEDGFRPIMQCHGTKDESPRACKGYLVREGLRNINVRFLLCEGKIENPKAVEDACRQAGIAIHSSYRGVAAKLGREKVSI